MKPLGLAVVSTLLIIGCTNMRVGRPTASAAAPATAATSAPTTAPATTRGVDDRWEKEISALEAQGEASPVPRDAIVFYGSSSVRLWRTLATDFPGLPVVNRGFGGSNAEAGLAYLDRIVLRHRPKVLVLYFGDNDIAEGHAPERIASNVGELVKRVHAALPETRILFIAVKPSPSRVKLLDKLLATNAAVKAIADADAKFDFVDIATPMLDANGQPRPELFGPDMLHMNRAGYELWTSVLAPILKQPVLKQP